MRPIRWGAVAMLLAACNCGPPPPPKFSEVQTKVFTASCTFSACHRGPTGAGNLILDEGKAYDQLVNAKAAGAGVTDRIRVVPGDLNASYLIEKLTNAKPTVGDRM